MNTLTETPKFELIITSSGLEQDRQIEIREAFAPFAARVSDWASKIASVDDPKVARETRLAMRRERIDLDKKHAEFKSKTLAWTRAVDGSKKVISDAYDSMEAQMEEIEKAEERRIAAEKAARKAERDAALRQYGVDVTWIQTGEMSDAQFLSLLHQSREAHEKRLADAKAAEEARIAREKKEAEERAEKARKEAEERERLRIENERLAAERKAQEEAMRIERERVAKERAEAEAKAKAERDAIEDAARKEREAAAAKAAEEKRKADAKLKAERVAREKLEQEARQREAAERQRKEAEEAAKRLAEQAPDAEKLEVLAEQMESMQFPTLTSEAGADCLRRAQRDIAIIVQNLRADAKRLGGAQ
ncbi:MAG: hypothetical protein IT582_08040 [Opitutaceae bacterium]|nr:hypothetical protein [Opitutaceae bacterium]